MTALHVEVTIRRESFDLPIALELPATGITTIFGASGTGKTSLLRTIAGLDRHDGAVIRFSGDVWQEGSTFVPTHRRNVGYVFQDDNLFLHLSVFGNLRFAAKRANASREAMEQLVEDLELAHLLGRMPSQLSGGEKQKTAIARVLLQRPRLLLLDEPLS
ncbi:MAG TPA: ATP-binding cassette domain-containing protein, partial [Candidatus Acidoferrum sp.]|nr:ATP-binding cassette domain-containing protein [Candidatus Acidoferrum sp.]